MLGETLAIVAALLGAVTGLFSREALRDVDPISANAIRVGVASVFMWILAVITGTLRNAKTIDLASVVFVIIACIVGMGIGDTLFFKGLTLLGVSRCFTISYTSPLLVVVMANLFLGEPFSLEILAGATVIVCGVSLAVFQRGRGKIAWKGIVMATGASLSWSIGTILLTIGLHGIDVILANCIRLPVLFGFLLPLSDAIKRRNINRRALWFMSASGILGTGLGVLCFMASLPLIGASKASPLSSSSPIWASMLSSAILKERGTAKIFLASILVVLGIYLISI